MSHILSSPLGGWRPSTTTTTTTCFQDKQSKIRPSRRSHGHPQHQEIVPQVVERVPRHYGPRGERQRQHISENKAETRQCPADSADNWPHFGLSSSHDNPDNNQGIQTSQRGCRRGHEGGDLQHHDDPPQGRQRRKAKEDMYECHRRSRGHSKELKRWRHLCASHPEFRAEGGAIKSESGPE